MNEEISPIPLLDLFDHSGQFLPGEMALGLTREGEPLTVDLFAPEIQHVIVAGGAGVGKTTLMRCAALSLALLTGQPWMQMAMVEPDGKAGDESFAGLEGLPHLLWPVAREPEEIASLLQFLVEETAYRVAQEITWPRVAVFVDGLSQLLATGGEAFARPLRVLLEQQGPGVPHFILAMRDPISVSGMLSLDQVTTRLVGHFADEAAADAVRGNARAGVNLPEDNGEFIVVRDGGSCHFRAAHADEETVALALEELYRRMGPTLLARPLPAERARPDLTRQVAGTFGASALSQS